LIDALIAGKLYGKPEQRTSANTGKTFFTAKVRVPVADGEAIFCNVICFSQTAGRALMALDDGAAVALAGSLTPKAWTDKNTGEPRAGLDLVAQEVLTAYHVTRRRAATRPEEPAQSGHDF
jgi:single-stranded DNA-binding protein